MIPAGKRRMEVVLWEFQTRECIGKSCFFLLKVTHGMGFSCSFDPFYLGGVVIDQFFCLMYLGRRLTYAWKDQPFIASNGLIFLLQRMLPEWLSVSPARTLSWFFLELKMELLVSQYSHALLYIRIFFGLFVLNIIPSFDPVWQGPALVWSS